MYFNIVQPCEMASFFKNHVYVHYCTHNKHICVFLLKHCKLENPFSWQKNEIMFMCLPSILVFEFLTF